MFAPGELPTQMQCGASTHTRHSGKSGPPRALAVSRSSAYGSAENKKKRKEAQATRWDEVEGTRAPARPSVFPIDTHSVSLPGCGARGRAGACPAIFFVSFSFLFGGRGIPKCRRHKPASPCCQLRKAHVVITTLTTCLLLLRNKAEENIRRPILDTGARRPAPKRRQVPSYATPRDYGSNSGSP